MDSSETPCVCTLAKTRVPQHALVMTWSLCCVHAHVSCGVMNAMRVTLADQVTGVSPSWRSHFILRWLTSTKYWEVCTCCILNHFKRQLLTFWALWWPFISTALPFLGPFCLFDILDLYNIYWMNHTVWVKRVQSRTHYLNMTFFLCFLSDCVIHYFLCKGPISCRILSFQKRLLMAYCTTMEQINDAILILRSGDTLCWPWRRIKF